MGNDRKDRGKVGVAEATPTPLTGNQIKTLRSAHQPGKDPLVGGGEVCGECYRLWPCTISRLLTMIPDSQEVRSERIN